MRIMKHHEFNFNNFFDFLFRMENREHENFLIHPCRPLKHWLFSPYGKIGIKIVKKKIIF